MFIIVEGPDGAGKSSLISALEDQANDVLGYHDAPSGIGVIKYHKGKPEELTRRWTLNDYVISIENDDLSNKCIIADRWHWGEVTYAPFKRPETDKDGYGLLGKAGWRWVELFLASRGALQIHLTQPADILRERVLVRGDDYVTVDELDEIRLRYENAAGLTINTTVVQPDPYDITKLPGHARRLVGMASSAASHVKSLKDYPDYIGPHSPRVLLVGDRHNITKRYGRETRLAFMPVDGNSGEFLLNNLPDDSWKTVGMINANDTDCDIAELCSVLGWPPVIALGRLAERGLRVKHGFFDDENYYTVPHPQFVRRFANARGLEYGQTLIDIANGKVDEQWILR